MRFAIAVATDAESWRVVRRAEELGFTRAWFYDTQMLSADPFVAMAAAALNTTRIRLGAGVLVPSNPIAPVAANAFASLNKLAPGGIDFGVGTGFTARRAMGLGAVKLAALEEYVRAIMALLREETIETEIEGQPRLIRLLNPELGLINTKDPIGLYVAAGGPRARKLTARLGAGWINATVDVASAIAALEQMRAEWTGAGHDRDALQAVALTGGVVLAEDEAADSPRAIAQVFFSSRRRHTRYIGDWSSDVCSSDLISRNRRRRLEWSVAGVINYRFAQPLRTHRQHIARWTPEYQFPFADHTLTDPITEKTRSEERRVGKECRIRRAT